jgi:hypothetical protein
MALAAASGLLYFTGSTAVAAVGAAALKGAIAGAVLNGGIELAKGGNRKKIFRASLKGAKIGAASSAALSVGSMALAGSGGTGAAGQLTKQGVDVGGIKGAKSLGEALKTSEVAAGQYAPASTAQDLAFDQTGRAAGIAPAQRGLLGDERARILAGIGEGAATGAIGYLGAKEQAATAAATEKERQRYEEERISKAQPARADIQPIKFSFGSRRMSPQDWWQKHLEGSAYA